MTLVNRFLYFVYRLEPDGGLMENVPRLRGFLPTCPFFEGFWD